jgi:Fe-S oxidoreductase
MTTTYDPHHRAYLDEDDVRGELTRVFDICVGCRRCVELCSTFPTLFDLVDGNDDRTDGSNDSEAAQWLTKAEQDHVLDQCFHCKLCFVNCPYVPGQSDMEVDFPRLMLRAEAMRQATRDRPIRRRLADNMIARTDLVGRVGSVAAPAVNAVASKPGSAVRSIMAKAAGVSPERVFPPFARQRFTTWFKKRPKVRMERPQGRVVVYPTCFVEYQAPGVGHDVVRVYERNGIECDVLYPRCCGAPFLHSGDVSRFERDAARTVKELAAAVRAGYDVVVPQPTCSYVLKNDYVDYVAGDDAEEVAAHLFDASAYLMRVHASDTTRLDVDFRGDVPESITYHVPCHLRAQNNGTKSRDLMKLTGAPVRLVQQCSGIDGLWGLRAENGPQSLVISRKLGDEIATAEGEVVAGDCHLANNAITEQTGRVPMHPIQVLARAYGIPEEV